MTPREQFQDLALAHADQLERDHRQVPYVPLIMCFSIGGYGLADRVHWVPDAVKRAVDAAQPVVLVAMLLAIPFLVVWGIRRNRERRWLKQLVCPGCKASLAYFLNDPDYYQRSKGKGIPDSVEDCPFCSLPFDVPFDDSVPERGEPNMEAHK